jgi:hypothetical protein
MMPGLSALADEIRGSGHQKKIFLPKQALLLAQRQRSQYRNSRDFVVDVADLHLLQTKTCGSESMLVSAGSGGVNVFFVKRWMDLFLGSRAATAAALLLALIARDEIGMPLQVIREDALIGASV